MQYTWTNLIKNNVKIIENIQKSKLNIKSITLKEKNQSIKYMKRGKSPGPDKMQHSVLKIQSEPDSCPPPGGHGGSRSFQGQGHHT